MKKDARLRPGFQILPAAVKDILKASDIYLLGPMGAGKTTFAGTLRQVADVSYISIGDITRRALNAPDADPMYAERENGRIPLAAVQAIVSPYLNPDSSYILDGVPRHPDEAEWIKAHIATRPFKAVALTLSAGDEALLSRIRQRAQSGNRPETPERIARRLAVYKRNHQTVLDILEPVLYKSITLDTSHLSPGEVIAAFCKAVEEL